MNGSEYDDDDREEGELGREMNQIYNIHWIKRERERERDGLSEILFSLKD